MPLILRNVKGSALTYTEMDQNLQYLESLAGAGSSFPYTGSAIISGSLLIIGPITGSSFTGSFTGSFLGTSSYALTASYFGGSVVSSSYSLSSSYALSVLPGGSTTQMQYNDNGVLNGAGGVTFIKGSNVILIVSASIGSGFMSGSFKGFFTGSYTGSYVGTHTGSFTGSYTGSLQGSSSYAATSSYFSGAVVSSSYAISASNVTGEPDATMDLTNLSQNKGAGLVLPTNRPPSPINGSHYFEAPNKIWIYGGGTWKSTVLV